jgi:predicted MFS family arabinose efflux permease
MALGAFGVGAGMRVLDPLLPMLAAEFGVGLDSVAVLIGGFALAYGLGQLASGPLGDRIGKLRVITASLALYALTLWGAAAASGLSTLLALRVAAGLASAATIPLMMAHIADAVPYAQRQGVLGRFLTGMVMAQLLSGPASGILAEAFGWRASFAALALVTSLVALLFAVRLRGAPAASGAGAPGLMGFARILSRPAGRRLMGAAFLDGMLLFGGVFPFVASLLIGRFGFSAAEAGLATAVFGLGSLVYTRSAALLVPRLGEARMVAAGGMGLALCFAALALAPAWWVAVAAHGLAGLLFFMLHGVLQARATEALPEARGTAVAAFAMSLFLGQSVGAPLFGAVIGGFGFTPAFMAGAGGVALLALWIRAAVILPRGA